MTIKYFYELTEIFSTPLDVMWLILAASYSYFNYGKFNWFYAVMCFIIVFSFHLIINMQNNYEDYYHATNKTDYKHLTSTIGKNNLNMSNIKKWILGLGVFPIICGLILSYFTGWPTLIIGIIAAVIGLGYSAGPQPLNSTPFSELAVCLPIGFFIPLTYVYLGSIGEWTFTWNNVLSVFLVCLIPIILMYNTQLANDTCDLQEDIGNNRHTLVDFIGKKRSLKLYRTLFIISIFIIPGLALLHLVPFITILTLLVYPFVYKKQKIYYKEQDKKSIYYPFIFKYNSIIMMLYIVFLALGTILKIVFISLSSTI